MVKYTRPTVEKREKMRKLRAKNWTYQKIAVECNVNPATVRRWAGDVPCKGHRRGRSPISFGKRVRIAFSVLRNGTITHNWETYRAIPENHEKMIKQMRGYRETHRAELSKKAREKYRKYGFWCPVCKKDFFDRNPSEICGDVLGRCPKCGNFAPKPEKRKR